MTAHEMVHPDQLGTPQVITDQNQQVVWQADYAPFGKATIMTETITNNIRFAGHYYDAETNTHHNGFRTYSPSEGRYLQSDPLGLIDGTNTYTYVSNNPIRIIDIFGLFGVDPFSPKHINRNRNNRCPAKEPNPTDCEGNTWAPDVIGGFYAHGRIQGYKTYRRLDNANPPGGFQCTYDPNVNTTTDFRGTYDYVSPENSVGGHRAYDVIPHNKNPNYENPDKTQIYCKDCDK